MSRMLNLVVAGALSALTLLSGHAAHATTVFSDNFDYGPKTVYNASSPDFAGHWNSSAGTVDYIAPSSDYSFLCRGTGGCVDLDGSSGDAGVFSTTKTFSPGRYLIKIGLFGNQRRDTPDDVVISLGEALFSILGITTNADRSQSFYLSTKTGGVLSFANSGGDNEGAVLTSVEVSSVPVPAALPLLATGLGLLGLLTTRRNRSAI